MQKVLRILRISEYVKSRVCGEAAHKCFYIVRVHKILLSEKKKVPGTAFIGFLGQRISISLNQMEKVLWTDKLGIPEPATHIWLVELLQAAEM